MFMGLTSILFYVKKKQLNKFAIVLYH